MHVKDYVPRGQVADDLVRATSYRTALLPAEPSARCPRLSSERPISSLKMVQKVVVKYRSLRTNLIHLPLSIYAKLVQRQTVRRRKRLLELPHA